MYMYMNIYIISPSHTPSDVDQLTVPYSGTSLIRNTHPPRITIGP